MTEQGRLISDFRNPLQVWSKKLNGKQNGERAVVLFNRTDNEASITVDFADIDLDSKASIRDIWQAKDLGNFTDSYTAKVPAHGAVLLLIKGKTLFNLF